MHSLHIDSYSDEEELGPAVGSAASGQNFADRFFWDCLSCKELLGPRACTFRQDLIQWLMEEGHKGLAISAQCGRTLIDCFSSSLTSPSSQAYFLPHLPQVLTVRALPNKHPMMNSVCLLPGEIGTRSSLGAQMVKSI